MRRFIGILITLAVLSVVAVALLNRGNYRSMLDTDDAVCEVEVVEESTALDTEIAVEDSTQEIIEAESVDAPSE